MEQTFTCNLCEAQCGLRVEVDGDRIGKIRGNPDDLLSRGHVCPKAIALGELYHDPDRLRAPVMRGPNGMSRVSWDVALDDVASNLQRIRKKYGKDSVAFYFGNPTVHSHRSSLAVGLLAGALGTRNRFDANSQDSNPRLFACMQMYGDPLAMAVPDFERTDMLLLLGANPAASGGSMMVLGDPKDRFSGIRARGGRVVLIDPRRNETVSWCDEHHFIRPGGDAALLLAMLHVIFTERLYSERAVSKIAHGVSELASIAREFSPARVGPAIGIDAAKIQELARSFAKAKRACAYCRVGVCQNEFGPTAAWLVEALNIVTGNLDREGGAMYPEAAADAAPLGRLVVDSDYAKHHSRVRRLPAFMGSLPAAAMREEIETEGDGKIRALVTIAGNPVLSVPNGDALERALGKLEYMASIDIYVNETTRHANVVLPAKHVFETGNYDLVLSRLAVRNVAKYSPPIVTTADDTRDDYTIALELALRLYGVPRGPLRSLARSLAADAPERLIDLLLRFGPRKTSLQALRDAPNGIDFGPLQPSDGRFLRTPDRMIRLAPPALTVDIPRLHAWISSAGAGGLVMIGRRHIRSNNSWLHNVRSVTKGPSRAQLWMHPRDAERRGLRDGMRVRVKNHIGDIEASLLVTDDVMEGVVSFPHGFGHARAKETMKLAGALEGESANALTDDAFVEPLVGTSILNGVPVEVSP